MRYISRFRHFSSGVCQFIATLRILSLISSSALDSAESSTGTTLEYHVNDVCISEIIVHLSQNSRRFWRCFERMGMYGLHSTPEPTKKVSLNRSRTGMASSHIIWKTFQYLIRSDEPKAINKSLDNVSSMNATVSRFLILYLNDKFSYNAFRRTPTLTEVTRSNIDLTQGDKQVGWFFLVSYLSSSDF